MHKPILHATLLALALGCSTVALAAPPTASAPAAQRMHTMHRGRAMHQGLYGMAMLRQLDLTATQRTSISGLMRQNFMQARPQMEALQQKRMAFFNATPGTPAYQASMNDLANAQGSFARQQVIAEADMRVKIYNQLTAKQRTKLASLLAERQARMQKFREEHAQRMKAHTGSTR